MKAWCCTVNQALLLRNQMRIYTRVNSVTISIILCDDDQYSYMYSNENKDNNKRQQGQQQTLL